MDPTILAMLESLQRDLGTVRKRGGKSSVPKAVAQARAEIQDAEAKEAERLRSQAVMFSIEQAEREKRARLRPMKGTLAQSGRGLRAKSGEALAEFAQVAAHKVSRGEMAWADIVAACQDTEVQDRIASDEPSDANLGKRIDRIEARRAAVLGARG